MWRWSPRSPKRVCGLPCVGRLCPPQVTLLLLDLVGGSWTERRRWLHRRARRPPSLPPYSLAREKGTRAPSHTLLSLPHPFISVARETDTRRQTATRAQRRRGPRGSEKQRTRQRDRPTQRQRPGTGGSSPTGRQRSCPGRRSPDIRLQAWWDGGVALRSGWPAAADADIGGGVGAEGGAAAGPSVDVALQALWGPAELYGRVTAARCWRVVFGRRLVTRLGGAERERCCATRNRAISCGEWSPIPHAPVSCIALWRRRRAVHDNRVSSATQQSAAMLPWRGRKPLTHRGARRPLCCTRGSFLPATFGRRPAN